MSGRRGTRAAPRVMRVDTTILLAGALTAGAYFDQDTAAEREVRRLAEQLYRRVDWHWVQNGGVTVTHGWIPERGFLPYRWEGYNEGLLLYVLGLGSPAHALPKESYLGWTSTYRWKTLYGHEFLYGGSLFMHQLAHVWTDFREIKDATCARRVSTIVAAHAPLSLRRGWAPAGRLQPRLADSRMKVSPLAGTPASPSMLVNVPRLVTAYYAEHPDRLVAAERVAFGTSGHRGSPFERTFNEAHILAITQAICLYRQAHGIEGPLFMGMDTHALSEPALVSALEVLTANGVEVMIDRDRGYTPTPVISHAILRYNRGRRSGMADGIVVTPSHNPPEDGGFKYNPPTGGPADTEVTRWIEQTANALLADDLRTVRRMPYARARRAASTHLHDYITSYVDDLASVVDMQVIRSAGVHIGVHPLGGAGVHYWEPIIARYGIAVTVVNDAVDPTFRFMTVDWDGKIRTDC